MDQPAGEEHPAKEHHWHFSDLLHPFQNRKTD